MIGESSGYACPSPEEFQEILNGLFTEGLMDSCQQKIMYMIEEELNDLFRCCALAIQQPNATKVVIYNALVVLKRPITPSADLSLSDVQNKWFSEQFVESRRLTKESVVDCLTSEYLEIRNEAAHCITFLLIIEQDNWEELIPFLIEKLISKNTSDNAKSGIVATFKEIFSTSDIFCPQIELNLLPPSFADLFKFLVFELQTEGLNQDIYLECTDCLEYMLTQIPQFFVPNIETNINLILSAIEVTFPSAELELYRRYHFLMLSIIRTFYNFANLFMDRITDFSLNGFSSEFRTTSIHFWNYVYQIEKENDFDGCKFYFIRKKTSEVLLEKILDLNLELKDPQIEDYQVPDGTDWNFFCSILLNKLVKASLKGDPFQQKDKVVGTIFTYIQFCANDAEKNLSTLLAIISALSSICIDYAYEDCRRFLISYFPFIIECCLSGCSRVSINSLFLLNKLIKKNYSTVSKPEFVESIFNVIDNQIGSENEYIIDLIIRTMTNCCMLFPKSARIPMYNDILEIVGKMISNDFILNSHLNGKVYSILTKYFQRFCDEKDNDSILFENGKLLLEHTINYLSDSFNFMISNIGSLQIELFSLIVTLIKFLNTQAEEYLESIIELVLKIIKEQNYIEECFIVLSDISYTNSNKILTYIGPILQSIDYGLESRSPSIIGKAALLIGAVFYNLKSRGADYIETSFNRLFSLLEDPEVDNTKDYYSDVVYSVALIIEALNEKFPSDARQIYAEKLIQLSNTPVNLNNFTEMEEKSKVFYSVAYGFKAILKVYSAVDSDFLTIFNLPTKRSKNVIIEFLRFVGQNEIYTKTQLLYYLQLIESFADLTNRKFNAQLNNAAINRIIQFGRNSRNNETKTFSDGLFKRISKL